MGSFMLDFCSWLRTKPRLCTFAYVLRTRRRAKEWSLHADAPRDAAHSAGSARRIPQISSKSPKAHLNSSEKWSASCVKSQKQYPDFSVQKCYSRNRCNPFNNKGYRQLTD